jgi:hypothetical protein
MKKSARVVHVMARCQDCDKSFDSYTNGQALAAKHAKKYKHTVTGEVGIAFKYEGNS